MCWSRASKKVVWPKVSIVSICIAKKKFIKKNVNPLPCRGFLNQAPRNPMCTGNTQYYKKHTTTTLTTTINM
jgi:hypothetical protein